MAARFDLPERISLSRSSGGWSAAGTPSTAGAVTGKQPPHPRRPRSASPAGASPCGGDWPSAVAAPRRTKPSPRAWPAPTYP